MRADFSDRETAVVEQLAAAQDLSKAAVLRQALRLYQLVHERLKAGETMSFSGDKERIAQFIGTDVYPAVADRDPDHGKIGSGHICKHGVRWPHPCEPCDDAVWEHQKGEDSLKEADRLTDWVRRAMRFIDLCDADAGGYDELHEDAEQLTVEGYSRFGLDPDDPGTCIAALEYRNLAALSPPPDSRGDVALREAISFDPPASFSLRLVQAVSAMFAEHGMHRRLAKHMGVSEARVSQMFRYGNLTIGTIERLLIARAALSDGRT